MKILKNKRGLSPVITTTLLIAIAVVLALIVFLYFRSFTKEVWTKKGMKSYEACQQVDLQAFYDKTAGTLQVTNNGNIAVYSLKLLVKKDGERGAETLPVDDPVGIGQTITENVGTDLDTIEIYPTLLGEGKSPKETLVCNNNKFLPETS